MPGAVAGAGGGGQLLAMGVRTGEAAEVGAVAEPVLVTKKVMSAACCAAAAVARTQASGSMADSQAMRQPLVMDGLPV